MLDPLALLDVVEGNEGTVNHVESGPNEREAVVKMNFNKLKRRISTMVLDGLIVGYVEVKLIEKRL